MDVERVQAAVQAAAGAAFREARAARPRERFYAFGLWTPAGLDVLPTCNTEEALRGAADGARWRPRAWALHRAGERHFAPVRELLRGLPHDDARAPERRARVLEACVGALRALDRGGVFGTGAARQRVVVALFAPRLRPEELLASARRLNPPAVAERLGRELGLRARGQAVGVLGEAERTYAAHAVSQADGGAVAAVVDDAVVGWSWPGGEPLFRHALPRAWAVALSPDGQRLVVGEGPGGLLRRFRAGAALPTLPGPEQGVSALTFAPDGREAYVAGVDEELWALDVLRGAVRASRRLAAHGLAAAGDVLAAATGARVLLLDARTLEARAALGRRGDALRCVACSPDGALVAAGGRAGERGLLALFDAATGRVRARVDCPEEVSCVAVSRDGRLVAAGDLAGEAAVWSADDGARLGTVRGAQQLLTWVAFSPDGGTLLTAGRDVGRGPPVALWRVEALAPMLAS